METSHWFNRRVRIRVSALVAALVLPLAGYGTARVLAHQESGAGRAQERSQDAPPWEYTVVSPSGFRSLDHVQRYMNQQGSEGWIFPDGTSIQKDEDGTFRLISPGEGKPRNVILRRRK